MILTNDSDGVNRAMYYDAKGRLVQEVRTKNDADVGDLSDAQLFAFESGSLNDTDRNLLLDNYNRTSYRYDAMDRATAKRDADFAGHTDLINVQSYDRWNNVIEQTDVAGVESQMRYNYRNNVIEERKVTADLNGPAGVMSVDEQGNKTYAETNSQTYFDYRGNALGQTDANAHHSFMRYDQAGQLIEKVAADGGTMRMAYDSFGRKVEKAQQYDAGGYYVTRYEYDRNNQLTGQYEAINVTNFEYDEAGRRIKETKLVSTDSFGNSTEELVQLFDFNAQGQVEHTRFGNANYNLESRSEYDLRGNKVVDLRADALSNTTHYDYFGRRQTSKDLGGRIYSYDYNAAGQMTAEQYVSGGPATGAGAGTGQKNKTYSYFANGQQQTVTDMGTDIISDYKVDRMGRQIESKDKHAITTNNYDELGRLTGVNTELLYLPAGSEQDFGTDITYYYDEVGNRRAVLDTALAVANQTKGTADQAALWYEYDDANRLLISQGELNTVGESISIEGLKKGVELSYNFDGTRASATRNWERTENELIEVFEEYAYDGNGRLVLSTVNGYATSNKFYDHMGRLIRQVNYDFESSDYGTFGDVARSVTFSRYDTNNLKLEDITYDFDNDGAKSAANKLFDSSFSLTAKGEAEAKRISWVFYGDNDITNEDHQYNYNSAGDVRRYDMTVYNNGNELRTNSYTYSYHYFSGASMYRLDGKDMDIHSLN